MKAISAVLVVIAGVYLLTNTHSDLLSLVGIAIGVVGLGFWL